MGEWQPALDAIRDEVVLRLCGCLRRPRPEEEGDRAAWDLVVEPIYASEEPTGAPWIRIEILDEAERNTLLTFEVAAADYVSPRYPEPAHNCVTAAEALAPGFYVARAEFSRGGKTLATDRLAFRGGSCRGRLARRIELALPGGWARAGELTGDGKVDFLHTVGSRHLAAYANDGSLLWRYDDPGGAEVYNSACLVLVDHPEGTRVACLLGGEGDRRLSLLDGATGEVIREVEWPHINEGSARWHHGGSDRARPLDAKAFAADFCGHGCPADVLLQTGDENRAVYTAFDAELGFLWENTGERGGHQPWVQDVDGDGRDETAAGNRLIDDDGTVLWEAPFEETFAEVQGEDHLDAIKIVNLGDGKGFAALYSTGSTCLDAATGALRWHFPERTYHGQEVTAARMRHDTDEMQVAVHDREYRALRLPADHPLHGTCRIDLRAAGGELLWSRRHFGLHMVRVGDWTGDGLRELILPLDLAKSPREHNVGIFDGEGRLLEVVGRMGLGADVTGSGTEDVVSWLQWPDRDCLEVYENADGPLKASGPLPLDKYVRNETD